MKRLLYRLLSRFLLRGFSPSEHELPEGMYAAAMRDVSVSEPLQQYLNMMVTNLIRRHLYVKDMNESSWYLGQIVAVRKIIKDAEVWKKNFEDQESLTKET